MYRQITLQQDLLSCSKLIFTTMISNCQAYRFGDPFITLFLAIFANYQLLYCFKEVLHKTAFEIGGHYSADEQCSRFLSLYMLLLKRLSFPLPSLTSSLFSDCLQKIIFSTSWL